MVPKTCQADTLTVEAISPSGTWCTCKKQKAEQGGAGLNRPKYHQRVGSLAKPYGSWETEEKERKTRTSTLFYFKWNQIK